MDDLMNAELNDIISQKDNIEIPVQAAADLM